MKPSNSPTQGQPNPRKIRLEAAFGPLFPETNTWYFLVGWDWFYVGNRLQETYPNQILGKHRIQIQKHSLYWRRGYALIVNR